jgi:hypothetical protein
MDFIQTGSEKGQIENLLKFKDNISLKRIHPSFMINYQTIYWLKDFFPKGEGILGGVNLEKIFNKSIT